ncbi:TonB-dependent siderophore receptor [Pseudomonas sp. B21-035]|uniref:TonB-dependent siderophore receptor n=1 Tax=Pseudomonas sp. B21-035 TaxID=2895484 RepID=UPI00215E8BF5|nr:TonB-dependent siderophore receptor [Pseudomonas sp. B21-035]
MRTRPIHHALRCCALLLPLSMAQAESAARSYDLAQDDLGQVLTRFAAQAGVVLSFDPALTRGQRSEGLHGQYGVEEGLRALLASKGLALIKEADGRYSLVREVNEAGAINLSATEVTSNQLGTITEESRSYTPGTIATATRLVLTPRETPQSITVVTRQHMDDFGLNNIDDVMRHTPGITVSAYDTERNSYYARGFAISNFQYDGIPSTSRNVGYSAGNSLSDMAIYDRVEVLKGATGLLTGAGSLGATINLVRKKPTAEFKGHFDLGAGSWDNYRSELDVSGPLTDSANVRGRAVAAYQDKHSFLDHYQRKTSVYYGILEFDLDPDTLLTVGADYQDNNPKGSSWSGTVPLYDGNGDTNNVSHHFNNAAKWSSWEQYTRTVFASLEHHLDNGWVAKAQFDHKINGYHAPLGSIQGYQPRKDGTAGIYAQKYTGETVSDSLDLYLSGPFQLFGREHELVIGNSYTASRWKGNDYRDVTHANNNILDFPNWDGDIAEPDWGPVSARTDDKVRQNGTYLTARLHPIDDLTLLLGGRLVNYSYDGIDADNKENDRLIPYVGAVYDLNDTYSLYASYTDIFMPQDSWFRDRTDRLLDPDEGQNYEVGIKGEFLDGRVNASLAYFEIHQSNRTVEDNQYNGDPTNPAVGFAWMGVKAKTKGFEAEVSGELAPGWQLQGGYTHKVIRDDDGQKVSTWEPQDQVSFYTSYKLKGALDRLTVGGGARWQGKGWQVLRNRPKGIDEEFAQDPFWLVDLMARYQFTERFSATVNANNLFDKRYYTNIGFYNSMSYGDPRNLMLTTRWDF